MITFQGVEKSFGPVKALDNFNLQVERGHICGLIGPNGAGKTTAMNILAPLILPDRGKAEVAGIDVIQQPREVRRLIGYMPDAFGFYDDLRVGEYLEFFAATYRIPSSRRPQLISTLLELVGLESRREAYVNILSRGMKQRLSLARCLIHDPQVLILDEPASGLDPWARAEVKEIIRYLKQLGKTVLVSSHILPEIGEICDDIAIIQAGRLVAMGSLEDITSLAREGRRIRVLEEAQRILSFLASYPGVKEAVLNQEEISITFQGSLEEQAELLRFLAHRARLVEFAEIGGKELEEIFFSLIGGVDGGD